MAKSKRTAPANAQPPDQPAQPSTSQTPAPAAEPPDQPAQPSAGQTTAPANAQASAGSAWAGREYLVVARRYRPQQFADLIGQEVQAQALVRALETGRVAHAYLFTGPRGTGKTSTARILAKALNCVTGPTPRPCDVCESCRAIAAGEDIDVLEIDGASNRGIEEVRSIRQDVLTRPTRSRYKIYIIDEVHMLTLQAFNALLKTLEEPPPHVKFIFATTDVAAIPATILSRCQRFDFSTISTSKIHQRLRQIVEAEALQADEEALELIARRAGGSMRDAQSMLEQLLSSSGERLTAAGVHAVLGTAKPERVATLAQAILAKDLAGVLKLVQQAADEGVQLGELLDQLIGWWRDLMVIVCVKGEAAQLEQLNLQASARLRPLLLEQARGLTLDTVLTGLDLLANARQRMRGSNHGRVLLEMALLRVSRLDELLPVGQLVTELSRASATTPAGSALEPSDPQKKNAADAVGAGGSVPRGLALPPRSPLPETPTGEPGRAAANGQPATAEAIVQQWPRLLASLGILGKELERGEVAISGPKALVIRFCSEYNHSYEYCLRPNSLARIEKTINEFPGGPYTIRLELIASPPSVADTCSHAGQPTASASGPGSARWIAGQRPPQPELVRKAIELFAARVLKVDEGFGQAGGDSDQR